MTIHLEQLRFYGYHGLYHEEKKIGAWFELDVHLTWEPGPVVIQHLHDTINYVAVYERVRRRMGIAAELLETLVMELAHDLKQHFPELTEVDLRITKVNMPISNFQGKISVQYKKAF